MPLQKRAKKKELKFASRLTNDNWFNNMFLNQLNPVKNSSRLTFNAFKIFIRVLS